MNLGKALRQLREARGLSANEAAKLLGYSRSYLSELESNAKLPSFELLERYATVFKTPVSIIIKTAEET